MKYYDVNQAVSRNRPLNFIVGSRGVGKTYGFKKFLINRFIKKKEEFIYLRQSKREIDNTTDWFGSLPSKFDGHEFKQRGINLFIDKQKCGELHALSEFVQLKSNEYPNVRFIIFDEFLDDSNWPMRAEKPYALASIIDTVFRNRSGCQVFCLANAESLMNEYFEFFGIYPKSKTGLTLSKDIALEVVDSKKFNVVEERANNWLGRVTAGTEYAKMAQSNEFKDDNELHIHNLEAGAEFVTNVLYDRNLFSIYFKNEKVWFTQARSNNKNKTAQVFTIRNSDPSRQFFKTEESAVTWIRVKRAGEKGCLYFDNKRTREICYVFLKKFLNLK